MCHKEGHKKCPDDIEEGEVGRCKEVGGQK